jgi:serine protease Do
MMGDVFGEIAEKLRRSTVQVGAGRRHFGSGVIWSDRRIVTNAHVLVAGHEPQIELWNGRKAPAQILKTDRRRDLAALQIDCDGLNAATHGDSVALRPGELLIAVGSPFGFVGAVSTGVFHHTGVFPGSAQAWIVSDVRLAPGNSGGPLANARGEVVGINTMLAGRMALSVPSKSVAQFLAQAETRRPGLGVVVRPMQTGAKGITFLVLEVVPQSAAERASLLPGDVLVGAAGKTFRSLDDFEDALESTQEGRLAIEFRRGDGTRVRRVVAHLANESPRAA